MTDPARQTLSAIVAMLGMPVEPRWYLRDESGSSAWDRATEFVRSQMEGAELRAIYEWSTREVGE